MLHFASIAAFMASSVLGEYAIPTWEGGPTFEFSNPGNSKFQIDAEVPNGTYFAIGFGNSMYDLDMIVFTTDGYGNATDMYSSAKGSTPTADSLNGLLNV